LLTSSGGKGTVPPPTIKATEDEETELYTSLASFPLLPLFGVSARNPQIYIYIYIHTHKHTERGKATISAIPL
jgi:hypothetical protein